MSATTEMMELAPSGGRRAERLAWGAVASALGLTAIGFGFGVVNHAELPFFIFIAACAMVGGLIAAQRPENPVGWLFVLCALAFALMEATGEYARYGLVTDPGALPWARPLSWPQFWLPALGSIPALALLPLLFPDGRLLSRRWRWVVRFDIAVVVAGTLVSAVRPGSVSGAGNLPATNPYGVARLAPYAGALDSLGGVLFGAAVLAGVISLGVRYRRASPVGRRQLKWLTFAIAIVVIVFAIEQLVQPLGDLDLILLIAVPVAAAIAILRHGLYDIDLIINRTLVYGALTACVVGLYVAVIGALGVVLEDRGRLVGSVAAAAIVAVLLQPLRERLQRGVNRLLFGERDDPYTVLAGLGQRLEGPLHADGVLPAVVEAIARALKLPYVAVTLNGDAVPVLAAAHGMPAPPALRLPLIYRHEPVGELVLASRAPGEAFTPADRRLLTDLARQVGVAAHAVHVTAELRRSREQLVAAREEERRRLRRDLHDGLGPALASMTLQVEAARDLLDAAPAEAAAVLAELTTQLQAATADIRRVVYALRPPALDDLGLLEALRSHARRCEQAGLGVALDLPARLPSLPAAVEVAVFRIAQEALTNVVRHAAARRCRLCLRVDGAVRIEITDDGEGLPEETAAGVGLISMRERAEELGGTCSVVNRPEGGTVVTAELPLPGAPPSEGVA